MNIELKKSQWRVYLLLMRFDKPVGIYLLLWPTYWALWVSSEGSPDPLVFVVFTLGVVLMRAAGCVINDYADREVDLHVERTQHRPITSGQVSANEALQLFFALILIAFLLVLLMPPIVIALSFVGVFLAALYPFMKRYTYFPQVFLGAAFGWAVPMAFAAHTDTVPVVAWLMFVATLVWAVIYDTMYAMVDREDDLKVGIKSTAILFGEADRVIIGFFQVMLFLSLLFIGQRAELGWIYFAGVVISAGLMVYHQWLIKNQQPDRCFAAFVHNHWLGFVVFISIVLDYWLI